MSLESSIGEVHLLTQQEIPDVEHHAGREYHPGLLGQYWTIERSRQPSNEGAVGSTAGNAHPG